MYSSARPAKNGVSSLLSVSLHFFSSAPQSLQSWQYRVIVRDFRYIRVKRNDRSVPKIIDNTQSSNSVDRNWSHYQTGVTIDSPSTDNLVEDNLKSTEIDVEDQSRIIAENGFDIDAKAGGLTGAISDSGIPNVLDSTSFAENTGDVGIDNGIEMNALGDNTINDTKIEAQEDLTLPVENLDETEDQTDIEGTGADTSIESDIIHYGKQLSDLVNEKMEQSFGLFKTLFNTHSEPDRVDENDEVGDRDTGSEVEIASDSVKEIIDNSVEHGTGDSVETTDEHVDEIDHAEEVTGESEIEIISDSVEDFTDGTRDEITSVSENEITDASVEQITDDHVEQIVGESDEEINAEKEAIVDHVHVITSESGEPSGLAEEISDKSEDEITSESINKFASDYIEEITAEFAEEITSDTEDVIAGEQEEEFATDNETTGDHEITGEQITSESETDITDETEQITSEEEILLHPIGDITGTTDDKITVDSVEEITGDEEIISETKKDPAVEFSAEETTDDAEIPSKSDTITTRFSEEVSDKPEDEITTDVVTEITGVSEFEEEITKDSSVEVITSESKHEITGDSVEEINNDPIDTLLDSMVKFNVETEQSQLKLRRGSRKYLKQRTTASSIPHMTLGSPVLNKRPSTGSIPTNPAPAQSRVKYPTVGTEILNLQRDIPKPSKSPHHMKALEKPTVETLIQNPIGVTESMADSEPILEAIDTNIPPRQTIDLWLNNFHLYSDLNNDGDTVMGYYKQVVALYLSNPKSFDSVLSNSETPVNSNSAYKSTIDMTWTNKDGLCGADILDDPRSFYEIPICMSWINKPGYQSENEMAAELVIAVRPTTDTVDLSWINRKPWDVVNAESDVAEVNSVCKNKCVSLDWINLHGYFQASPQDNENPNVSVERETIGIDSVNPPRYVQNTQNTPVDTVAGEYKQTVDISYGNKRIPYNSPENNTANPGTENTLAKICTLDIVNRKTYEMTTVKNTTIIHSLRRGTAHIVVLNKRVSNDTIRREDKSGLNKNYCLFLMPINPQKCQKIMPKTTTPIIHCYKCTIQIDASDKFSRNKIQRSRSLQRYAVGGIPLNKLYRRLFSPTSFSLKNHRSLNLYCVNKQERKTVLASEPDQTVFKSEPVGKNDRIPVDVIPINKLTRQFVDSNYSHTCNTLRQTINLDVVNKIMKKHIRSMSRNKVDSDDIELTLQIQHVKTRRNMAWKRYVKVVQEFFGLESMNPDGLTADEKHSMDEIKSESKKMWHHCLSSAKELRKRIKRMIRRTVKTGIDLQGNLQDDEKGVLNKVKSDFASRWNVRYHDFQIYIQDCIKDFNEMAALAMTVCDGSHNSNLILKSLGVLFIAINTLIFLFSHVIQRI